MFVPKLGQRIDRVGDALAPDLAIVDGKAGLSEHRGAYHVVAQLRARKRRLAMRRIASGKKSNLGQLEGLQQLKCGPQMPEMDGIESTAEEAYGFSH